MNIFFVDRNPFYAAKALADQHLGKMMLESIQMLSNACEPGDRPRTKAGEPYKPTHINHPCSVWARSTRGNWMWLILHMWGLRTEYETRFKKYHACFNAAHSLTNIECPVPSGEFFDPPQCMPDEFKGQDTVTAYRRYYVHKTETLQLTWTNAEVPSWIYGKFRGR